MKRVVFHLNELKLFFLLTICKKHFIFLKPSKNETPLIFYYENFEQEKKQFFLLMSQTTVK
jgi:hypothetical protein